MTAIAIRPKTRKRSPDEEKQRAIEQIQYNKALAVRDGPAIILYGDALGALSMDKAASQNALSPELLHPKSMITCTLRALSTVIGENYRDPIRGGQSRPRSAGAEGQCLPVWEENASEPKQLFQIAVPTS